jgi:hypothetical protein
LPRGTAPLTEEGFFSLCVLFNSLRSIQQRFSQPLAPRKKGKKKIKINRIFFCDRNVPPTEMQDTFLIIHDTKSMKGWRLAEVVEM